jgi:hypothetical protein
VILRVLQVVSGRPDEVAQDYFARFDQVRKGFRLMRQTVVSTSASAVTMN